MAEIAEAKAEVMDELSVKEQEKKETALETMETVGEPEIEYA